MTSTTENLLIWEQRIQDKIQNGMTIEQWCEKNGISKFKYYYWNHRIRERRTYDKDTITVVKGKGNKSRIIPMVEPLISHLWEYLTSRLPIPSDKEPLLLSSYGNRMSVIAIEQLFRRHLKLAGLDNNGYTLYSLRHTYGSLLLQNGADLIYYFDPQLQNLRVFH